MGGLVSVTWPLTANPPINIMFGEPTLVLGLLLLAAAAFLWTRPDAFLDLQNGAAFDRLIRVATPVSWLVFVLGLILLSCTVAVFRFGFVGAATAEEPISGLVHGYPWVENTFVGLLYALSATGPLLAPVRASRPPRPRGAGGGLVHGRERRCPPAVQRDELLHPHRPARELAPEEELQDVGG